MAKKVLLTGATGTIGGEVLRQLLIQDTRRVVCPVRAKNLLEARQRGHARLRQLLGREPDEVCRYRVQWQPADLTQPELGIDPVGYEALVGDIGEVIHCAGTTQPRQDLESARQLNVTGTARVLALAEEAARRGRFRRFLHVSAAQLGRPGRFGSRLVSAEQAPAAVARDTWLTTKAEAERLVRAHLCRLPLTIVRPSYVLGASRSGQVGRFGPVYTPLRLLASGQLGLLPEAEGPLDVVPADFVAEAIVAFSRRHDTRDQTLHVVSGAAAPSHAKVFDLLVRLARRLANKEAARPDLVNGWLYSLVAWIQGRVGTAERRRCLRAAASFARHMSSGVLYDNAVESALLARENVVPPRPQEFLPQSLEYALRRDFGRPRRARRPARPFSTVASAIREASGRLAQAFPSGSGVGPVTAQA